jgi:hypothetical protein
MFNIQVFTQARHIVLQGGGGTGACGGVRIKTKLEDGFTKHLDKQPKNSYSFI